MREGDTVRRKQNPNRILTLELMLAVSRDRAAGMSWRELSQRYGVSVRTVRTWLDVEHPQPKPLQPCGTNAAYARHLRRGERPCPECCAAHAESVRQAKIKARVELSRTSC